CARIRHRVKMRADHEPLPTGFTRFPHPTQVSRRIHADLHSQFLHAIAEMLVNAVHRRSEIAPSDAARLLRHLRNARAHVHHAKGPVSHCRTHSRPRAEPSNVPSPYIRSR